MPKRNLNTESIPAPVGDALRTLGRNIEIARTRRRMTQRDLARRAGLSHMTMGRVERGHPTTAIGAYFAALWALGLEREVEHLADPDRDEEGKTLELSRLPRKVRSSRGLDGDF